MLPKEEIKRGGLILAQAHDSKTSTTNNQADIAIVLAVGSGYTDEESGADVPMDIEVGNVILISRLGLKLYSQFPGLNEYTSESVALTRDTEIHCAWPSIQEFENYRETLNKQEI